MDTTTYTVAEVSAIIGRSVTRSFPYEVWVHGEIRDLNRASSGHVYFNLVDAATDDSGGPLLPVTLFQSERVAVNRVLARSGAVRMTDGVEVRIRGRISHYAARGTVQLRMTWIDTDFTVGRLAAERERLIRSLQERGLSERNPSLAVPVVPLRVGLVTSVGSAAYADFIDELRRSSYAWEVGVADVRVQGSDAVSDVIAALAELCRRDMDVIAVVRGGGAQTDLAAFDTEEIAVAIADCRVPVFTGIGHEIDVTVADLMARSFKTPTACAAGLVTLVDRYLAALDRIAAASQRAVESRLALAAAGLDHSAVRVRTAANVAGTGATRRLRRIEERIGRAGKTLVARQNERVRNRTERLHHAARRHTLSAHDEVDRLAGSVPASASRFAVTEANRIETLQRRLALLDPANILARGWSVTRTDAGALVTDPNQVAAGSVLRTTLAAGEITSVVAVDEEEDNG